MPRSWRLGCCVYSSLIGSEQGLNVSQPTQTLRLEGGALREVLYLYLRQFLASSAIHSERKLDISETRAGEPCLSHACLKSLGQKSKSSERGTGKMTNGRRRYLWLELALQTMIALTCHGTSYQDETIRETRLLLRTPHVKNSSGVRPIYISPKGMRILNAWSTPMRGYCLILSSMNRSSGASLGKLYSI